MVTARFRNILWSIAILSIAVLIVGCGGGGGGGSSGSAEEQKTVKISGKILDNNNNPIAYATVTITSDPVIVETNQWGEFFAEVIPGDHTITIEKDNVILYQTPFATGGRSSVYLGDLIANYLDTVSPSIPAGVIATAQSSSQISLSWSASTDDVGVTGYQVYRKGSLLKTVTGTSTTDTGLSASTQYCYTVKAGDAAGNWSADSTQSCATTSQASTTSDNSKFYGSYNLDATVGTCPTEHLVITIGNEISKINDELYFYLPLTSSTMTYNFDSDGDPMTRQIIVSDNVLTTDTTYNFDLPSTYTGHFVFTFAADYNSFTWSGFTQNETPDVDKPCEGTYSTVSGNGTRK
jgi:hypothetical protein